LPKQLSLLGGEPLVGRTVKIFLSLPTINEVIVVAPPALVDSFHRLAGLPPEVKVVPGGEARSQSTLNGLLAVSEASKVVLAHDGVRPLVEREQIEQVRKEAFLFGAAALAIPLRDTLKKADDEGFVLRTVDRQNLWRAQTPQGFRKDILLKALSFPEMAEATDEAGLVEAMGVRVKLVPGSPNNIKVTEPEDLVLAEKLSSSESTSANDLRVGQGFDFHRFDPERPLHLGCVLIPGEPGLAGHSDADVLAHALIDALLGAAGLGDIGLIFPPSDERWKGAAGADLLRRTRKLLDEGRYRLINADLTLIGEKPRLNQHRAAMQAALAEAYSEKAEKFNLKGKTTEGMGFAGRGEGLSAAAVVFLAKERAPLT
jgi:2-C-methyl-D-erythritol 4-phosphate cytidylyltransferase/2-C-methyl-D-erythritol 2,4-cyclodiphosphate synthase